MPMRVVKNRMMKVSRLYKVDVLQISLTVRTRIILMSSNLDDDCIVHVLYDRARH